MNELPKAIVYHSGLLTLCASCYLGSDAPCMSPNDHPIFREVGDRPCDHCGHLMTAPATDPDIYGYWEDKVRLLCTLCVEAPDPAYAVGVLNADWRCEGCQKTLRVARQQLKGVRRMIDEAVVKERLFWLDHLRKFMRIPQGWPSVQREFLEELLKSLVVP